MKKQCSLSLDVNIVDKAAITAKRFGFKNVSNYVEFCVDLANAQDEQSFQMLTHFNDIKPGKFLQILLLDKVAKDLAEVEVCGAPQDTLFYIEPSGQLLTGEKYFNVRYAKHKRAYMLAKDFKEKVDKSAADVAFSQAVSEVEQKVD